MRWIVLSLAALVAVLSSTNVINYVQILLQPLNNDGLCPVFESLAPTRFHTDNSTVVNILSDPDYRLWSVANLAGAVQVDTSVYDNMPGPDVKPEIWAQFGVFQKYLEQRFPKIHAASEIHKVNHHGLVLHWKGSDESLKPLMLTAHQDVVPVQVETLSDWSHPPFEGYYDGKYVYGRGAFDCKNSLIAVLEAAELLVGEDYVPKRGVVMAFGFDEEISGLIGAATLAIFLEEKFGKNGIYAIIDEGPGLISDPITKQLVAIPGTGEKGYMDIEVELVTPGGHSSVPPDHTSVGIISELVFNIEADPYVPRLTQENPMLQYLQCLALNSGDKIPKLQRKAILRAGYDKLANLKLVEVLKKNKLTRYLIQTSQAVDLVKGGEKANALPEDSRIVVNHRISVGETVEQVKNHFVGRVKGVAEKHGLNLVAFGKSVYETEKLHGHIKVGLYSNHTLEYAPVSPSDDTVWEYLARTTRHVFENLVLKNSTDYPIITAPGIMPANTDTKYYWNLTKNIYRYSPMIVDYHEINIHSVDEKVEFDGHLQLTAFYYEYIQNVDSPAADNR